MTRAAFDFATKADLRGVELRPDAKIETKVEAAKSEIIKWMSGTIGFRPSSSWAPSSL